MAHRFTHILVAVDGSQPSKRAVDVALALSAAIGCELTLLAVAGRLPAYAATMGEVDDARRAKHRVLASALEDAKAVAAELEAHVAADLVFGSPAAAMTRYARAHGCDLIVVAYARRPRHVVRFRSTANRVARRACCPVMFVN